MEHVKRNWLRYALAGASVIVAGLAAKGYIPTEVASWLTSLLSL